MKSIRKLHKKRPAKEQPTFGFIPATDAPHAAKTARPPAVAADAKNTRSRSRRDQVAVVETPADLEELSWRDEVNEISWMGKRKKDLPNQTCITELSEGR